MSKKTAYGKLFGYITLAIIVGGGALLYGIPMLMGGTQMSTVPQGTGLVIQPTTPSALYVPYTLSTVTFKILDEMTQTAAFGANDVYGRIYNKGTFSWTGPYEDIATAYSASTGAISFNGSLYTGTQYDAVFYQGDGGTNLYAIQVPVTIPQLPGDKTSWSYAENNVPKTLFMGTEGAFKSTALDNMEGDGNGTVNTAWDESSNTVTLNKSASNVAGCNKWDFTIGNSVAGAYLRDPVIVLQESDATPLTDINDIKHIYLSVKSGSGVTLPSGDLLQKFRGASPIVITPVTSAGKLGSGDSATATLTVCFENSESDMGTGNFVMYEDDLGNYRNRDLDNDVRASAETTTFVITS